VRTAILNLRNANLGQYLVLPERYRGGRVERWAEYWKGLYADYRNVAVDTYADCKNRPFRTSVIASGLGFLYYAAKTNPDERSFRDRYLLNCNRFLVTLPTVRNPATQEYLRFVARSFNEGLVRRFSFGIFSIMWVDNFEESVDLYASQCTYLKPEYLTFHERIIDVGFLGKWHLMNKRMIDYDVNPDEWKNTEDGKEVLKEAIVIEDDA